MLDQRPDAEICSDEPTFIAHVTGNSRLNASQPGPTLSDVASTAVGLNISGSTPGDDSQSRGRGQSSGFTDAKALVVKARAAPPELPCVRASRSPGRASYRWRHGPESPPGVHAHSRRAACLGGARVPDSPGASVALRFADGSGHGAGALLDYVGNVLVDGDGARQRELPSDARQPLASIYEAEFDRLQQLDAAIAASGTIRRLPHRRPQAVRTGRPPAGGSHQSPEGRRPTLGLYASYAYAETGIRQIRSVESFMRLTLHSTSSTSRCWGPTGVVPEFGRPWPWPCCPMLSQGWALLGRRTYVCSKASMRPRPFAPSPSGPRSKGRHGHRRGCTARGQAALIPSRRSSCSIDVS